VSLIGRWVKTPWRIRLGTVCDLPGQGHCAGWFSPDAPHAGVDLQVHGMPCAGAFSGLLGGGDPGAVADAEGQPGGDGPVQLVREAGREFQDRQSNSPGAELLCLRDLGDAEPLG